MKLKSTQWLMVIVLLILAALACKQPWPTDEQEQVGPPGTIVFEDDFYDSASGWNKVKAANGETDYADGIYRIIVNQPNLDIWARPGLKLNDAIIEVDTLKIDGVRDNRFGIICRATEPSSFYTFIISSDGYYGIGKIKGEEYSLLGTEAMQRSEHIHLGAAANHLRADCIGNILRMYVNGQKIAEVQDDEFPSGDVGLIAGTYDTPGTYIIFDNFSVYKP